MKRVLTFCFSLLFVVPLFAQVDYKIDQARTVKMGYQPFPKDQQTRELSWTALDATCMEDITYGAWFELKVKSDRAKFTVHTGGDMGDIVDPRIYLGEVVEDRTGRKIVEVCCYAHQGDDGEFSIECVDLKKDSEYFVLVSSDQKSARFAISATDKFEASAPQTVKEETPSILHRIFGRITDKEGNGKSNVKVSLLDEGQQPISTVLTDDNGVFNFEKLEPDQVYMTRIEEDDTDLTVEMFLIDEKGSIKTRSTRIGDRLYGFGIDQSLSDYIRLLSPKDYQIALKPGEKGIVGRVVDRNTYLYGRQGVEVGLYSKERRLIRSSVTDKNGFFSFVGTQAEDYDIQVKSDKEKDFTEIVIVDEVSVPTDVANSDDMGADGFFSFKSLPKEVVALKRMEVEDTQMKMPSDFSVMQSGQSIVLKNILFGAGSADLLPSSYPELDALASQLTKMASIRIEVSGHTDNQGSSSTNLILSENRAKAVVDYLIAKGIDIERLTYKGFGETKPVDDNTTAEGRQKNRRVQFKVLD